MIFPVQILGRLQAVVSRHGLAAAVVGAAALAGCGQKGPLFLPVPPTAPVISTGQPGATPAVIAPAPAASASR
ncbi:MAG: LPS translocon maturation chaperone LptM [Polaromonas sp.]